VRQQEQQRWQEEQVLQQEEQVLQQEEQVLLLRWVLHSLAAGQE
jgi:hypothetical protein